MTIFAGTRLGLYEFLSVIGAGGIVQVLSAEVRTDGWARFAIRGHKTLIATVRLSWVFRTR